MDAVGAAAKLFEKTDQFAAVKLLKCQDEFGMTAGHIAAATGDLLTLEYLLETAAQIRNPTAGSTSLFERVTETNGSFHRPDSPLSELFGSVLEHQLNLWNQSALDLLRLKHRATAGLGSLLSRLGASKNNSSSAPRASIANVGDTCGAAGTCPGRPPDSHVRKSRERPSGSSRCQEKGQLLSKAQAGWDVRESTFGWGPLGKWNPIAGNVIEGVAASTMSPGTIMRDYLVPGRPLLLKGVLNSPACKSALELWGRQTFRDSKFAAHVRHHAYRVPYGEGELDEAPTVSVKEFIDTHMGVQRLTNQSVPRYIFDNSALELDQLRHGVQMEAVPEMVELLQCIPWQLQELLTLPPAGMPGVWSEYTIGIGGAGSGAPFHAHEAAVNIVIVGTKRWFLYPPAQADYTTEPIFDWVRDTYPTLSAARRPIEMLQQAGDVVILPPLWGHATIAIGDCVCISKVLSNKATNHRKHLPAGPLASYSLSREKVRDLVVPSEAPHTFSAFRDLPLVDPVCAN